MGSGTGGACGPTTGRKQRGHGWVGIVGVAVRAGPAWCMAVGAVVAGGGWRVALGEISSDHVERLVRAVTPERADDFRAVERDLVTVAATGDWAIFERAVAMFETAADDKRTDPSDPDDVAKRVKRERAHRNARPVRVGDRWEIVGSLDKVGGQIFSDAWERIRQELWEADMVEARRRCGPDVGGSGGGCCQRGPIRGSAFG